MASFLRILIFLLIVQQLNSQHQYPSLHYYLPDIPYDQNIPSPEAYFGFQVGEWHLSQEKVQAYFEKLATKSDKIELVAYGTTHENRTLFVAMISSEKHLKNKKEIQTYHQDLSLGKGDVNLSMPAILYQGYSIHGNELSGMHASVLAAYYLVAGQSDEVKNILNHVFVLMDPCLNPDGTQRFSTWVNSYKSNHTVTDAQSSEFSESWPGGRYNHYWSDMNRDWLLLVHPESRGRIRFLLDWNPTVLTDHHEMGTNNTFFFQPGVPEQNNPNTPSKNFLLTEEIGKFYAGAFDSIGSLYYTKHNFDDYYYGKGSTYSDAIGAIGILLEQGSSRGHAQNSSRGVITFPFTIKNQLTTSLATYSALIALKPSLLAYRKNFLNEVYKQLDGEKIKGYIFTDKDDVKRNRFLDLLLQHGVEVFGLENDKTIGTQFFPKGKSYVVPLQQKKPLLAKTIFEDVTRFSDSSFYDISGWTLSRAFGLTVGGLTNKETSSLSVINNIPVAEGEVIRYTDKAYAWVIPPDQWEMHRALFDLQQENIRVQISFTDIPYEEGGQKVLFSKGSLVITVANQTHTNEFITKKMEDIAKKYALKIHILGSGNATSSVTLGHPDIKPLQKPEVAILTGNGISSTSAGEIWYHTDVELNIPATLLDIQKWGNFRLDKYNTLVLPSGNYGLMSESDVTKLKEWVRQGNTLITFGNAAKFLSGQKIIMLKTKTTADTGKKSGNYGSFDKDNAGKAINGVIFSIDIDNTHPVFFGFEKTFSFSMKTDTFLYQPTTNLYASPAKYSQNYHISGFHPNHLKTSIPGSAVVTVHGYGNGRIICFLDPFLFRNYWMVGQKAFNNALFYSKTISAATLEKGQEE